ncbi:hypothetical protein ACHWQZ_G012901 [Mnemiopsis leidyi]
MIVELRKSDRQKLNMSKKQAKKQLKNLQRCLKHLSALVGHECTVSRLPSKSILLGNAGHANGIGRADVVSLLQSHLDESSYKLYFPPDKQFSILFTQDICESIVDMINATKIKGNILYCAFLSEDLSFEISNEIKPPGLKLFGDIISEEFEGELMELFLEHSKNRSSSQDELKNRVTLHYGYKFDYKTNLVDLTAPLEHPIPASVRKVLGIIQPHISITPNQLTVNIYQPGQGIPKHVDTHSIFTSEILSVSLGSDVVMDFKHPTSGKVLPVLLPRRSLTVMSGESRYLWHHGITPRKTDALQDVVERQLRISLTLRECTPDPCTCNFPSQCDSQNYGKPRYSVEDEEEGARLEEQYVSAVYEEIADHFSSTRHSPWPGVVKFLNSLPSMSLVVDVGCGNGKYLGVRSDITVVGNDNSYNLCSICQDRGHEVFACNALNIPLRPSTCDSVICIAMLHHITTPQRRVTVLENLAGLLTPGGLGLVTVWAQEQHLDLETTESCRPCPTDGTEEGVGRRHFDSQDVFVDWQLKKPGSVPDKSGSKLYYRYYHVFVEGELAGLISQVPGVELVEVTYEKANWCAVFRKL